MKTKIEKIILKEEELEVRAHFIEKFVAKLKDPENYDYTGVVVEEKGYCVCGHPILYQFQVKHKTTGQTEWVGSVCINHFQNYNKATYEALIRALNTVQEKIKALKKAQKEALQDKEIEVLKNKYKTVRDEVNAVAQRFREQRAWLPYPIYGIVVSGRARIKEYTRKGDYIRAYKKAIEVCEKALTDNETIELKAKLRY